MINEYLAKKDISMYQLSKICGVPYNTLKDVSSGKTDIRKCSGETIHRISQALGVSMDTLFAAYYQTTSDFERFRNSISRRIGEKGPALFVYETLGSGEIRNLYVRKKYDEAFYLLSEFDRVCMENGYPEFFEFDDIRLKGRQAVESMEKQDGEHFLL